MLEQKFFKPSHEEWLKWAQVVIDRLTTCVHVYSKPPYDDVFIYEKERQEKNARCLALLKRIYSQTEACETPTDSLADVANHDERVIAGLGMMFAETLALLPELSGDMQKLLKSAWQHDCAGRIASELFCGPMGNLEEGIGSGHAEHGRLPLVLTELLERETTGDKRQPRQELHRNTDAPVRGDESDELKRRWADKNGQFMRSAGRVD